MRITTGLSSLAASLLLIACAGQQTHQRQDGSTLQALSVPVSNNAAVIQAAANGIEIYSFLGLESGKTWKDVSRLSMRWQGNFESGTGLSEQLTDVPGEPRLASTAELVNGIIYLFGGYTVAEDHTEVSTPEVMALDTSTGIWRHVSDMPVPVDDAVSMVYRNRFIYLVSGWHQDRNVDRVQIYDTVTDSWQQATAFPGEPLFGHAGGLVGESMVICDGVRIVPLEEPGKREFRITDACYRGDIDPLDLTRIDWKPIQSHPGPPLYRSASVGVMHQGVPRIMFAGGSDNPYNYNGIGYNKTPSSPTDAVFSYDTTTGFWEQHTPLPVASMDHRKLLHHNGQFYLAGGMRADQRVVADIVRFSLDAPAADND